MKRLLFVLLLGLVPLSLAQAQDAPKQKLGGGEPAPGVNWLPFEEAVASAAESDKKLIIDIYAPWCGWCTKLQNEVYTRDDIQAYVNEHFLITRLDIDNTENQVNFKEYTLSTAELAAGLGAQGTPTTVFLAPNADYITRLPGFVDAEMYLNILEYISTDSYEEQSFDDFMKGKEAVPAKTGGE